MNEYLTSIEQIVTKNVTQDSAEETLELVEFVLTIRKSLFPGTLNENAIRELWEGAIRPKKTRFEFLIQTTTEFRIRNELFTEAWESFCGHLAASIAIDYEPIRPREMYPTKECLVVLDKTLKEQLLTRSKIEAYLLGNPWLVTLILFTMLPPTIQPLRKFRPERQD